MKSGNSLRDHSLTPLNNGAQRVCLSNLESLNADLIKQVLPQKHRLKRLNNIAIEQMKILVEDVNIKRLKGK
jgi:hypothetical protein